MEEITLIVLENSLNFREGIDPVCDETGVLVVTYQEVTDEQMNELRNASTTPKRVNEILSSLANIECLK